MSMLCLRSIHKMFGYKLFYTDEWNYDYSVDFMEQIEFLSPTRTTYSTTRNGPTAVGKNKNKTPDVGLLCSLPQSKNALLLYLQYLSQEIDSLLYAV